MKFSKTDAAALFVACAASSVLFFFFLKDVNSSLPGRNGDSVGTISFRKNAATRKASDAFRWMRLSDGDPVYSGDTIRTSGLSEASVHLDDGTAIDVLENSMLRLDFKSDAAVIDLSSGDVTVSGGSAVTRVVRAQSSVVEIDPHSEVSFSRDGDSLVLEVLEGTASVRDGVAGESMLRAHDECSLNSGTGKMSVSRKALLPKYPSRGARVVSADGSPLVEFRCDVDPSAADPRVELSADPRFSPGFMSFPMTGSGGEIFTATAAVDPGRWYWRVASPTGEVSATIPFSFLVSNAPIPTRPDSGAIVTYRKSLPDVRFSWGSSPEASAYVLELSNSPDGSGKERLVRSAVPSVSVGGLGEGVWYWRIRAEYEKDAVNVPPPSAYRSFTVAKSAPMRTPVMLAPADGTMYDDSGFLSRGFVFSWQAEPEAIAYEVRFFADRSASSVTASVVTGSAWYRATADTVAFLAQKGLHYWSVAWKDSSGELSPFGEPRSIENVDGRAAIRPTFPPDGYLAASDALGDVRFSWVNALGARSKILFSRDPNFSSVGYEKDSASNSVLGVSLAPGSWFWRARVLNADGTAFTDSQTRSLRVIDFLDAPRFVSPGAGTELVTSPEGVVPVSWDPVPEADYYTLRAFKASSSVPSFTAERIIGSSLEIPVRLLGSGPIDLELQPFAEDSLRSSRVAGRMARVAFGVIRFARVELANPVNGVRVDGLSAWVSGVRLSWHAADAPDSLSVSVTRNGMKYPVPSPQGKTGSSLVLPRLPAGAYSWRLKAFRAGIDISPAASGSFTVLGIPPLPAPVPISPTPGQVFGPAWFVREKKITFAWKPVDTARSYTFRLLRADGMRLVFSAKDIAAPSFDFSALELLDRGGYVWEVSAAKGFDGESPARAGSVASARFSVSLPSLEVPKPETAGTLYGL